MDEPHTNPGTLFPDGFTLRDEANAIVMYAFRLGPLEDLHVGKYSTLLEDETLSRIRDPEMKVLMIKSCEKMEEVLRLKETDPEKYASLILHFAKYCRKWERGKSNGDSVPGTEDPPDSAGPL